MRVISPSGDDFQQRLRHPILHPLRNSLATRCRPGSPAWHRVAIASPTNSFSSLVLPSRYRSGERKSSNLLHRSAPHLLFAQERKTTPSSRPSETSWDAAARSPTASGRASSASACRSPCASFPPRNRSRRTALPASACGCSADRPCRRWHGHPAGRKANNPNSRSAPKRTERRNAIQPILVESFEAYSSILEDDSQSRD